MRPIHRFHAPIPAAILAAVAVLALAAPGFLGGQGLPEPDPEAELTDATFEPLTLEPQIFAFPDEEFARVGERIALGLASIQERRWWYRAAERYTPFQGAPPPGWRLQAWQDAQALETAAASVYNWVSLGPNGDYDVSRINGGPGARDQGRATALWTHMEGSTVVNKDILFLGFADGGVWKSTDGGDHWRPLTDFQPTLSIGALDVLPGDDLVSYSDATIYVGTGEGNFSAVDKDGVGVLKSTDGGSTWEVQTIPWQTDAVGVPGLHRIRRLAIDRNVPGGQSVWVAGDGGVYHSADGGATWALVTGLPYAGAPAGSAYPGGCWIEYPTDLLVDTENTVNGHSVLLAAYGRVNDAACASPASEARRNNGVYRSTDGGATWQKIAGGTENGFPAAPGLVGRITLLQAPSNPKHVYALVARSDNFNALGIFDTLDATADPVAWSAGSTTNFTGQQGWYDITGAVHPTDDNRLIVGGIDNWLSIDRGQTITPISSWSAGDDTWAHADHHHAVWVDDGTYYDANDGGLNVGLIDGTHVTWIDKNGDRLSTLQFYGLSQSATDPYKINAGLQDNGHALLANGVWQETFGGDGGFAATDQTDDSQAYEEYVYAAIRHSDTGGDGWRDDGCMQTFGGCAGTCGIGVLCVPDNHAAFITNFILDAHNQDVMYVGTNYLYRNVQASDAGKVWQRIASDGLNGDFVYGAASARAYVSIVHTPPANRVAGVPPMSQILYLGTSTGRVWRSDDGGLTWSDLTKAPLPAVSQTAGRFVTWIDTDATNADRVVVTYSGWAASTDPPMPGHVFRSLDGGATWTDVSGALPDEPFNTLAVNPNPGRESETFAASDTGVYVNRDTWGGGEWVRINNRLLPHVSINMLQFTNATEPKRLRAATHGRGIWELFEQAGSTLSLDRESYDCGGVAAISLLTPATGAGGQQVTVSSAGEPGGEVVTLLETPPGSGHYTAEVPLSPVAAGAGDGAITVLNGDHIVVQWSAGGLEARAVVDCDACGGGSTAAGGNLRVDPAGIVLSVAGGDGDEFLDNCETGTVSFEVANVGAGDLTGVRIERVTSSNSAVRVQPLPATVASGLARCAKAQAALELDAAGLAPGEILELALELTADEMAAAGVSRTVTVRFDPTEQDFSFVDSRTYGFETGMEGWEVVRGSFERTEAGAGGALLTSHYLASSELTSGICDEVRSPVVKLTPESTLTIHNQFEIEPITDAWYDRANVGLFDVATGSRTTVVPGLGRPYLAEGANGTCVTGGQPGWAGPGPGWLPSAWSAADLGAAEIAGRRVQVDVAYGTDPLVALTGLWIDEVTLTDFELQGADAQDDVCPSPCTPELGDGDPAVEYTGGWHRKSDPAATGGSYHRRVGNNPKGAVARVVFEGDGITYLYAVSSAGGAADLYLDGALADTVSYAGQGAIAFGHALTWSGLGAGSHELAIVHRSGAVYVDGFRFDCASGAGADPGAPAFRSETTTETASAGEGPMIVRSFEVAPGTVELSVVVEGSALPVTVELLDTLGNLLASGGQLLPGLALSGLDTPVELSGTYTVRFANTLAPGKAATISVAATVRAP